MALKENVEGLRRTLEYGGAYWKKKDYTRGLEGTLEDGGICRRNEEDIYGQRKTQEDGRERTSTEKVAGERKKRTLDDRGAS